MDGSDRAREFREQGFVVERGFFGRAEVAPVLAEIERLEREDHDPIAGDKGGLIFTIEAFRRSEAIRRFIAQQRLIDFLAPVAGRDLWVRWDQSVTKRPGAAVFRWHQDNAYNKLRTEHFQIWVALTESHMQNGGLWLSPGSHRRGLLPHRSIDGQKEVCASVDETVCVDASVGDLVLFSSLMLHRTGPNEADRKRVAFVAEYMPLHDYDYAVAGPYFVVAKKGRSDPHFCNRQAGATWDNQRLYWKESLLSAARHPVRNLRRAIKSIRPVADAP
jgi:ectoine hydroxylase-related dioxygenase (phytanoyl-CoA dioxygenase family)